ncbi:uncharacterized protein LOC124170963 [Ischnura elegans]|uniref:uncharacterized protein LOC124170963 n=1 Tax=Ischnura elegans TaxID=197161 RepID=UPI001ED87576|nr:uncharacterized protein LOC124170963 [Ischnura elegans]
MKRKKFSESVDESGGELQPAKKRKHFTGMMFRQKILGDESVEAMKSFLEIYREGSSNQDIVMEYLESGGNGEEILLLLPSENKDPEIAVYVFSVLECIFLRVMTDLNSYLPEAEETAKCILQSHLPAVYLLLSVKSSIESKKAVLRLLTAMSTLSGRVAKNILTYLKINSSMLYGLTRSDSPSRPLFINFVLSFIVEGNPHVVKLLLDKKDYLRSIAPGLLNDPEETVEMVLAILQKNVLEHPLINKTTKMHAFNSNVLKSFLDLFNWRGPQKILKKKRKSLEVSREEVDPVKKANIQEALYSFLSVLCGSTKSGVVFFDPTLGISGKNQNLLVHKVLEELDKPWESPVVAKLLANIFAACPDLIPSTSHRIVPFLEPRASKKWFNAMEFVVKVIESAEPGIYLSKPKALLPGQLVSALERILIPKSVLHPIVGPSSSEGNTGAAIFHPEMIVRHTAVHLLNSIMKTASKFLEYDGLEHYFLSASTADHFCQSFLNLLAKSLPDVGTIIRIWRRALDDISGEKGINVDHSGSSNEHTFTAASHLQELLELLLVYAKWWPPLELEADCDDVEDGWGLLNRQSFLKEIQQFDGLELLALELLSSIGCLTLSADKSNAEIIQHLLHSYAKEDEKKCYNPWKNLILTLFLKTNLFEGNEVEAFIWVHCFRTWYREKLKSAGGVALKSEEVNVVADFIASSLNNLMHSSEEYMKVISELFAKKCYHKGVEVEESKMKSSTQVFYDMMKDNYDSDEASKNMVNEQKGREPSCDFTISPLLPAALSQAGKYSYESEEMQIVNEYLEMVIIHILYGQSTPKPLLQLIKGKVSSYSPAKSLEKYIKSWSTQTPRHLGNLLDEDSVFSRYGGCLLEASKSGRKVPLPDPVNYDITSDGLDILLLFRMIIFHVASMAQERCLNEETISMAENILDQLIDHPNLCETEGNSFLKNSSEKLRNLCCLCFQSLFHNPVVLEMFEPLGGHGECQRLMTHMVEHFLRHRRYVERNVGECDDLCTQFKEKFLLCFSAAMEDACQKKSKMEEWDQGLLDALFASVTFNSGDVVDMLGKMKNVPATTLVNIDSWKISGPGFVVVKFLKQLCKLKMTTVKLTLDAEIFSTLADHLSCIEEIFESSPTNGSNDALILLEECLLEILQIFPHLIDNFPKKLFISLISSKLCRKSACNLSHFMISHSEVFATLFLEHCDSHWNEVSEQFERLMSHLQCILDVGKQSITDSILTHILKTSRDILVIDKNILMEIPSWISAYPQLFKLVVMRVMDDETCFHLYNQMIANPEHGLKATISSLEVLHPVFERIENASSLKLKEKPRVSFLQLMLSSFIKILKTAVKNESFLNSRDAQVAVNKFSHMTSNLLNLNESDDSKIKWRRIKKCTIWKEFLQLALKVGIGQSNGLILKCLERICSKVLSIDDPESSVLYKMTILHSKFLEIMLENKNGKVELLELISMLLEKNSSNKSSSLVPTLLSSYGLSLNKCDILILKVLKMLDDGGMNYNQFSPFLWGSTAASFFSIKRKAQTTAFSAFSILRQPKADQVLDLLDVNMVKRTIDSFPMHRKLQAEDSFDAVYDETNIYDPCFYLPILSHILAPENPIKIYKVVQSGALALTVIALGSSDAGVRSAAMHILARFYSHLETGRPSKEKKLWLNFIDSLRNGFTLLASSKDAKNVSSLQLPSVVSVFLARSSLVMADPQHIMFFPLHNYFLAKPALDLDMVPEFFRLFNSTEVESRSYRYWILEVLRDGMKSELDFLVCLNSGALKVLLTSFCCVTTDEKSKMLILEILTAAVKTPSTAYYLVKGHGLIPWIQEVIIGSVISHKKEPNILIGVIHLLSNIWFAVSKDATPKSKSGKESSFCTITSNFILQLFLYLLPKLLSIQIHLADYYEFMDSFLSVTEICYTYSKGQVILEEVVKNAIALGKKVLNSVNICEDALEYGHSIFPTSPELHRSFDDVSVKALKCLFKFVALWKLQEKKL